MIGKDRYLILTLAGDVSLCVSAEQWRTIKATWDAALIEANHSEAVASWSIPS